MHLVEPVGNHEMLEAKIVRRFGKQDRDQRGYVSDWLASALFGCYRVVTFSHHVLSCCSRRRNL